MGADVTKKLEIIISSKTDLNEAVKSVKVFEQMQNKIEKLEIGLRRATNRLKGYKGQSVLTQRKIKALEQGTTAQARAFEKAAKAAEKKTRALEKTRKTTDKTGKSTKRYRGEVDKLGKSYKRTEKEAKKYDNTQGKIRGHTEGLRRVVGALRNQILLFLFALRGVIDVITSSVQASNQLESALVGLRAVTEKTGTSFYDANKFIQEFTETGLISVASTAAGLKNLLSAGFGMPEAIQLMKTLGDAAAFNRQGTLEYGAAIEGATQGIKNQNCCAYHTQIYDPVRGQTKTIEEWHDEGTVPCVLSVNRQTGEMEVIQAEYLHYNGENEVFEIELEDGTTIEATANHRFLTQDGFKFLEDLDLDNDVLYYVDEEEVENIICEERKSITNNNAIVHNIMIDNDSKNSYIENKQYKEESCQDVLNVEKNYQKERADFVPKSVVEDGIKKNIRLNLKQKDVPTVIKNFLERQLVDSVHPNVLSNIKLRNQEKNQKSALIAQRNSSQKSQRLNFVVTNAQQNSIKNQRQTQNEANNALTVEKTSSVGVKGNLKELSFVQMNVSGSIQERIKDKKFVSNVESHIFPQAEKRNLRSQDSVQEAVHQSTMELEERRLAQEFLQKLQLNARSAEKILNLIEDWSKEDLDYFVQKNVDQKLLVSNSVEKIALALLLELRKHVKNVERNSCYSPGKLKEEKDFVQNNVKIKPTQGRYQERTTQTTNMETLEKEGKLDLQQSSNNGDLRFIKEIPFDVYDAVEMLKVILTHIIFIEQESFQKKNLNSTMASPFVKTATQKSIKSLNQHLKNFQNIIPTPLKIKRIISRGFKKTFDLSVPEQFNYLASYIVSHNSIMTDNAGITKNLNIMYKEFARTIGKGAMSLSELEKRQAIFVGFLKEGAIFQGNMNLLTATYIGKTQKLSQSIFKAKAAFGGLIKEGLTPFVAEIEKVIAAIGEWVKENETLIKSEVKVFLETITTSLKVMWDVLVAVNDALKIFGVNIKDVIVFLTLFKGITFVLGKVIGLFTAGGVALKILMGVAVGATATIIGFHRSLFRLLLVFRSTFAAVKAGTSILIALKGAMMALGGPVTIIIGLITVAAAAWAYFSLKSKQASTVAAETLEEQKRQTRELTRANYDLAQSMVAKYTQQLKDKDLTDEEIKSLEKKLKLEEKIRDYTRREEALAKAKERFRPEEAEPGSAAAAAFKVIEDARFKEKKAIEGMIKVRQEDIEMQREGVTVQEEKIRGIIRERDLNEQKFDTEARTTALLGMALIDHNIKRQMNLKNAELLQATEQETLDNKSAQLGNDQLLLQTLKEMIGWREKDGKVIDDNLDKQGKSIAGLLSLIARLEGEVAKIGLEGIGLKLVDFQAKIAGLEVQYKKWSETLKKGNVHLERSRELIDELTKRGPLDILKDTFQEIQDKIAALGMTPLESKFNKISAAAAEAARGLDDFWKGLTLADLMEPGMLEYLTKVEGAIETLAQTQRENLTTDTLKKWADKSKASIDALNKSIFDLVSTRTQGPFAGGLFGAGEKGEMDRLKIKIETAEKLLQYEDDYKQRLKDIDTIYGESQQNRAEKDAAIAVAAQDLERQVTLTLAEETEKRIVLVQSEWEQRFAMMEQLVGGWQELGGTLADIWIGQSNEMQAQIDRQRELMNRGKIDQKEFEDRKAQIEKAAQKDREKSAARFVANMLRQAGQVAQAYLLQAAAAQFATASATAASSSMWATHFLAQATALQTAAQGLMAIPVWGPALAASYMLAAGGMVTAAGMSTAAAAGSVAAGIGLGVAGIAVGVGTGLAAGAIEANNLGSEGGFLGTPTEDVFEDRNRRLGGSIRAQEVHLSINPVTYIQAEGDIFIGEGITVETFKGLVNEAFINRAQDALEEGTLQIDALVNVKG